jgi:hypothetical protein
MLRWCFAIALLALVGCTADHPMDKPGTWSLGTTPSANDANLRTMIVTPRDLVRGTGERTSVGREATGPVNRLFTGKRAVLPVESASKLYGASAAGGTGANSAGDQ